MISGSTCHGFELGPISMIFATLEIGMKIGDFSGWSWGHPRSWQCARLGVIGSFPGPITTIPGSLKLRKEYIGYMVHWKQDYRRMLRSLVAPSRGAGGFRRFLTATAS